MGDTEIDAEDIMFGCFQHTRRFLKDPAYNTIGVTLQRENENNETGYILCDTRGVPRVVCFGGMKKTPEMNPGQRLRYFVYPTHAVNGWVSFKIYLRKNCRAKLKPVYEAANRSFEGLWTAPGKGISVRSPGVECHVLLKISQKPSDTENSRETFPPLCFSYTGGSKEFPDSKWDVSKYNEKEQVVRYVHTKKCVLEVNEVRGNKDVRIGVWWDPRG